MALKSRHLIWFVGSTINFWIETTDQMTSMFWANCVFFKQLYCYYQATATRATSHVLCWFMLCIDCKYPTFLKFYASAYFQLVSHWISSYIFPNMFLLHLIIFDHISWSTVFVPTIYQSFVYHIVFQYFPCFDCRRVAPDLTRAIRPMCPLKRAPREKDMQICHPNWDFNQEKMSV